MNALNPVPLTSKDASLKNPLALAFLGDTVWDLLIRQNLLHTQAKAGSLHKSASMLANASAQAKAAKQIESLLSEEEYSIYRRGCNAHCHHNPPKNQNPVDYSLSSGLESLLGFLYLTEQYERLQELFTAATHQNDTEDAPCPKGI